MFILESPAKVWLWCGKGCTGDEREFAKVAAKTIVPRETDIITEGKEPEAFWSALGGKEPYAAVRENTETPELEPRLFQCTNAVGLLARVIAIDVFADYCTLSRILPR